MKLKTVQRLELPPAADMHVHMRQGELMNLVVPTVVQGGVDTVFVMPNLVPPLTTIDRVLEYEKELKAIAPDVTFLMSLFLHESITPEVVKKAAAAGITGIKLYPQGGTTNSDSGVSDLKAFYNTFAAMEEHGLILNIHGEVVESLAPPNTTLEEAFLPTLKSVHERFPKLRIVLEHCTTAAAVEAVKACGPTVGATITAHHLYLTHHDACCNPFAFCKPIPKKPTDRDVLIKTIAEGNPKFFFGSDSAPHLIQTKTDAAPGKFPAGVFTQPYATQLVLLGLEEGIERGVITEAEVTQEKLAAFLSTNGRRFYQFPEKPAGSTKKIVLERKGEKIPKSIRSENGSVEVGISREGTEVFSLRWE
ncbi:amidohydrolase 2 [Grosmannia clavigera kw1407]|uniref:dihydroorotase n=1 Tax=Grosmannia clavigera (strain kw1407 / UAMH 11150) TaxID=655863 RepID=F0XCV9_GROCL|nr:amidohydrolase 2 [Grosmannia clavigera kw1407]EFX04581.1 amidohydrolase 2 [Grosmannia clavigera kw1407]